MDRKLARALLGLAENHTEADLKVAFRRLARITHPDAGGSSEAFQKAKLAYETLASPQSESSFEEATETEASAGANVWDSVFASLAMSYLGVDPETLESIQNLAAGWVQDVTDLRRRAATQLLWIFVGRVPVGAAFSVAKTAKYKSAGESLLGALAAIENNGLASVDAWLEFANAYKRLLQILGQTKHSEAIQIRELHVFLASVLTACRQQNLNAFESLSRGAAKKAESYVNDLPTTETNKSTAGTAHRFGVAVGRNTRALKMATALFVAVLAGTIGLVKIADSNRTDAGTPVDSSLNSTAPLLPVSAELVPASVDTSAIARASWKACWFAQVGSTLDAAGSLSWIEKPLTVATPEQLFLVNNPIWPVTIRPNTLIAVLAFPNKESASKSLPEIQTKISDSFLRNAPTSVCQDMISLAELASAEAQTTEKTPSEVVDTTLSVQETDSSAIFETEPKPARAAGEQAYLVPPSPETSANEPLSISDVQEAVRNGSSVLQYEGNYYLVPPGVDFDPSTIDLSTSAVSIPVTVLPAFTLPPATIRPVQTAVNGSWSQDVLGGAALTCNTGYYRTGYAENATCRPLPAGVNGSWSQDVLGGAALTCNAGYYRTGYAENATCRR
jgi:curved DNA-binding protein CbpA